jgi:hypothetical protein
MNCMRGSAPKLNAAVKCFCHSYDKKYAVSHLSGMTHINSNKGLLCALQSTCISRPC